MAMSRTFWAMTLRGAWVESVSTRWSTLIHSEQSCCRLCCCCCVRPFLFGYAKPVPVNFRALRHPRVGTILIAAAGPGMNLFLATIAALAFHIVGYVPAPGAQWLAANLRNAILLNVILAIFNPLPILPLDGGRILAAVLPSNLGRSLARFDVTACLYLSGCFSCCLCLVRSSALISTRYHDYS